MNCCVVIWHINFYLKVSTNNGGLLSKSNKIRARKKMIILKGLTGNSFLLMLACTIHECFGQGAHALGGNMAATDQEESPKPLTSPTEDVVTSGQTNEAPKSEGALQNVHETSSRKPTESPDDKEGEKVAIDGGRCVSHSGVSVESSAGTERASCKSPGEQKPAENMTDATVSEQRALDGCRRLDDEEAETKTPGQEMEKSGMRTCF